MTNGLNKMNWSSVDDHIRSCRLPAFVSYLKSVSVVIPPFFSYAAESLDVKRIPLAGPVSRRAFVELHAVSKKSELQYFVSD